MSETLIAVIIGGLLTGAGSWIALAVQHRKWKTELRISHIGTKRDRFEAICDRVLKQLNEAMLSNAYPSTMTSDIFLLLPDEVSKIYKEMIADNERDDEKNRVYYLRISVEMKKVIRRFDDLIEELVTNRRVSS